MGIYNMQVAVQCLQVQGSRSNSAARKMIMLMKQNNAKIKCKVHLKLKDDDAKYI